MSKEELEIELKKLYKLFLTRYIKLEEKCKMNLSVKCFEMFCFLFENGYLSYNKSFQRKNERDVIILNLIGVQVITGAAVCRHTSSMLCDIFQTKGMNSHILGVYVKNEKSFIWEKIIGNHALAFIEHEKIFDPLNHDIYYPLYKKRLISLKGEISDIKGTSTACINLYRSNVDYEMIIKRVTENYADTFTQDKIIMENTRIRCEKMKDVFENFYENNKELYSEINDKLTLLKKM